MKKILFVLLAAAMLFGCQKKDSENPPVLQDVSFNASEIVPDAGARDDWTCKDDDPTNAWVAISYDGITTDYYPELFELSGNLYTKSVKLPVGADCCIETFILYKEVNGTSGYQAGEDIVTHGTPLATSDFAGYVTHPLPYCFDVEAFTKVEIDIQVLCFQDVDYAKFGFVWFNITEIKLSGFCFFGDICLNGDPFTPADFNGSLYGTNLPVDVPAIMEILVFKDGSPVPNPSFDNETDQSEPLCVYYYDDSDVSGEVFTFELWLWLPDEGGFSYQLYATFTSADDGDLDVAVGDDLILDFVVGTCGYGDADVTFDWIWTPSTDPGGLVITEIMNNPSYVSDTDGEWFEVYNSSDAAIDMMGMIVRDDGTNSFTISSSLIVPSHGYVVLGNNDDQGTNGGVQVDYDYGSQFQLANSDDEVIIETAGSEIIDEVWYDGGPDFPDPTGASMSLDPSKYNVTDNDDGSNWCEATSYIVSGGDKGTPGALNDDCGLK